MDVMTSSSLLAQEITHYAGGTSACGRRGRSQLAATLRAGRVGCTPPCIISSTKLEAAERTPTSISPLRRSEPSVVIVRQILVVAATRPTTLPADRPADRPAESILRGDLLGDGAHDDGGAEVVAPAGEVQADN